MVNNEFYAGSLIIGENEIAFFCNHSIYKTYLKHLFPLEDHCANNSFYKSEIHFFYASQSKNLTEVNTIYSEKEVVVSESRKMLFCKNNVVFCHIFVEVKNHETFYYTYVIPAVKLIMANNKILTLHSSVLRTPENTYVALVAPSGCGKTSLAILLLRHGATLMTDDLVFIDINHEKVFTFPREWAKM